MVKLVEETIKKYYDENNNLTMVLYLVDGKLHRQNKSARTEFFPNGMVKSLEYFLDGREYRENVNDPVRIEYNQEGELISEKFLEQIGNGDLCVSIDFDKSENLTLEYLGDDKMKLIIKELGSTIIPINLFLNGVKDFNRLYYIATEETRKVEVPYTQLDIVYDKILELEETLKQIKNTLNK